VAEGRSRAELRVRRMTDKISLRAEAELDLWVDPHAAEEKETDDQLWGGPQTPRKPLWGHPQEPPVSLLVRGEHIIMIALEGNEDILSTGGDQNQVETTGKKLGLEYFMRAVRAEVPQYAQRPVVVLAQRVPYDWPKVAAQYKDVYLITGRPLAEENLQSSGLKFAKAVIIYQRGPVTSSDPTLVDAQAIFGTALTESLLQKAGKEILTIVDLNLDDNAYFVDTEKPEELPFHPDELSMTLAREMIEKERTPYVDMKRYVSGQMFASGQALTSLVANMLYNPAIGSLVLEMLQCRFVVVPVPPELGNKTYQDLYEHMLRRRNLVAVALLRNFTDSTDDEPGDEEEEKVPAPIGGSLAVEDEKPPIYDPKAPPGKRFVYTMPEGERRLFPSDGVMCVVPKGDSLAFLD